MNKISPKYFIDSFKSMCSELSNQSLSEINELIVEEMYGRYDKLMSKKAQYPEQFNKKDIKQLEKIGRFIKEENRRKVEPGSLEDRMNRFLDENLPK